MTSTKEQHENWEAKQKRIAIERERLQLKAIRDIEAGIQEELFK